MIFWHKDDGKKWSRKEFVVLIKTPLFYEVNSFNRKWLAHEGISKYFFLDHFSLSFLGQKYYFLSHIPF